jgi:hypothetical protein
MNLIARPGRLRKTARQVKILHELFKNHEGPIPRELRERAVELTGLKW